MSLGQAPEGACLFPLCSFCWGHKLFRVKSKQQLVRYAMNVQSQMHPFRRKAADTWAWIPERHSSLRRGWTAVLFNRCVCMCTCVCVCVCACRWQGWSRQGGSNNNSLISWEAKALQLPHPSPFSSRLVSNTFPWDDKENLNYHKQAQGRRLSDSEAGLTQGSLVKLHLQIGKTCACWWSICLMSKDLERLWKPFSISTLARWLWKSMGLSEFCIHSTELGARLANSVAASHVWL